MATFDDDDLDDEELFHSLRGRGHFKDIEQSLPVHDPYDQVYSTAVFTPPVHRDFLMEDMQSYMDKIKPLQTGSAKYGPYVDEFSPGELSKEQLEEMKEAEDLVERGEVRFENHVVSEKKSDRDRMLENMDPDDWPDDFDMDSDEEEEQETLPSGPTLWEESMQAPQAQRLLPEGAYSVGTIADNPDAQLDADNLCKYFDYGKSAEGVPKKMAVEFDLTASELLMMRKPAMDVIQSLHAYEEQDYSKAPDPFTMFTGDAGVGKSTQLAHVMEYARSRGWLTMYLPTLYDHVHDTPILKPSVRHEGLFDQHDFANLLLKKFYLSNHDLLEGVSLKTDLDRPFQKCSNLKELTYLLSEESVNQTQLARVVMEELSLCTELPVVLGIDDYNLLYRPTYYHYNSVQVSCEHLALLEPLVHFKKVKGQKKRVFDPKFPMQNGFIFAAETHAHTDHSAKWDLTRHLDLSTVHKKRVPSYSSEEVAAAVTHYFVSTYEEELPEQHHFSAIKMLTDGNAERVKYSSTNPISFIPIKSNWKKPKHTNAMKNQF